MTKLYITSWQCADGIP